MLNWLTGNCELFGLPGQNWMLVVAGGLLLYIAVLVIGSFRQPASTSKNRRPVAAQSLAPSAACSDFERKSGSGTAARAACGDAPLRL
jgi:hypothetical protein